MPEKVKKAVSALMLVGLAVFMFSLTACGGGVTNDPGGGETSSAPPHSESSSQQPAPDNSSGLNEDDGDGDTSEPILVEDDENIMWLAIAPAPIIVESVAWEFDAEQIGDNEVILSVSPSGKHILTVDSGELDLSMRLQTGKNELGWMLNYISLYSYQTGGLTLAARIDFDASEDPELNDTLATCGEDGVAWSEDETRVLLTPGISGIRNYFRMADADVFLIDFAERSVENLTGDPERLIDDYKDITPRWNENNTAFFIRYALADYTEITLMKIDIETGELTEMADLSYEGLPSLVYGYNVSGDVVYYIQGGGFYMTNLAGGSGTPVCLLELPQNRDGGIHPYANQFLSMHVSPDGRWACLTVQDMRLPARDIPIADDPMLPQPDPNSAISSVTGEKWVPCHNILLFNLIDNKLVDPFTDARLKPDAAIATAAAFAPDSGSMLCAVFGDGGIWTADSFSQTSLYQIRIDDSSFDAMRVYTTETDFIPESLSWLGTVFVHMYADSPRVLNFMKLLIPAAFTRYMAQE